MFAHKVRINMQLDQKYIEYCETNYSFESTIYEVKTNNHR